MNDRITHFGGINRSSARHLARKEDERRTDAGADLFACGNVLTRTGAARKRQGMSIRVHLPEKTLVWPDVLGNFRPQTGKRWNFGMGNIFGNDDDYDIYIWIDIEPPIVPPIEPPGDDWILWDYNKEWRYRNIVRSIDARLRYFNLPLSGLLTNKCDSAVTQADINAARAIVQGWIPSGSRPGFVSKKINSATYDTYDANCGVQPYADFAALLASVGAGKTGDN